MTVQTTSVSKTLVLDVKDVQAAARAGHSALAAFVEQKLNAAKITTLEFNGDEVQMLKDMATDALELWKAKGFPAVNTSLTVQQSKELCERYRWFANTLRKL